MANLEYIQQTMDEQGYEEATTEDLLNTAKAVGEFALDLTPIVGDIKGAIEYEDDIKMARGLFDMGYDEGSIVKMGMGAGLAAAASLGLVPLIGMPGDIARATMKPAARTMAREMDEPLGTVAKQVDEPTPPVSNQTEDVFMPEFRKEQIEQAKRLPASERRRFLKEVNRPTPKVFHGAGSMSKPRMEELARYEKNMNTYRTQYIDDPLYDLYKDKETGLIKDRFLSIDELVDKEVVGSLQIPHGQVDGEITTIPIKLMKESDNKLGIYFMDLDTNALSDEPMYTITSVSGDRIAYDQLKNKLGTAIHDFSVPNDIVGERRIDVLKREGFKPFSEFEGESGLAGFTQGQHAELGEKLLSTSIDPGVSMKPRFGGMDTKNIVYADIPSDKIQRVTPEQYNSVITKTSPLPPLEKGKIAYRLPKSTHLEDEIAIPNPELLDVKALSDNPPLEKLVQEQQDKVERIRNNLIAANTGSLQNLESVANQRKAYDLVRSTLTDLQSMGKYAQGQGTGDTYDNFVEELLDLNQYEGFADIVDRLEFALPKGTERHSNMVGIKSVLKELDESIGGSATFKKREELRHIPDSELRDVVYRQKYKDADTKTRLSESGITIDSMDEVILTGLGYKDLKRLLFLGTQKMNKGGLAIK